MDNTEGALNFKAVVDDTDFTGTVSDMESRIKDFATVTEKAGEKMDASFKKAAKGAEDFTGVTKENLEIQKQVIKDIEANLTKIKDKLGNIAPGKAKLEVIAEYQRLNGELEREKAIFSDLEQAVKQNEAAHNSLYSQLRKIRDEMARMEASGQANTGEYRRMQEEAALLTEALSDVNRQARILGSSGSMFQGIISGLSGITGAFSAAQGTVGLFVGESENLQKVMLKVQSLLAITIGLQQAQQALDKDQAFMLVVVRKAKEALTGATYRLATALGVSTAAAQVFMGVLTLGLSVAITAAIVAITKWQSAQKKAREDDKKFTDSFVSNAGKQIAIFRQLQEGYASLGNDLQKKEKFIISNKDKFKELGVAVKTVSDAENILIKNAKAFEEAMILKAKSIAAMELASEKYKEWLQEMSDAEKDYAKKTEFIANIPTIEEGVTAGAGITAWLKASKEKSILADSLDVDKLEQDANAFVNKYRGFLQELDTLNQKFNLGIIPEGTDQKDDTDEFTKNLNKIKGEYQRYTEWINSKDTLIRDTAKQQFEGLLKEGKSYLEYLTLQRDLILKKATRTVEEDANLTKLNNAIAELTQVPKQKEDFGDIFIKSLSKIRDEYDRFFSWISSSDEILKSAARQEFAGLLAEGESYLEYLTRQRDLLLSKTTRTKSEDANLAKLNNAIAEETEGSELDDFSEKLNQQVEKATSVLEVLKLIKAERDAIAGDNTELANEKKAILDKTEQDAIERGERETQELLSNYSGYLSEKIQFEKNYLENKRKLTLSVEKATNAEELAIALNALDQLEKAKKDYQSKTGDAEYDNLLKEYQSFEDKRQEIYAEYAEKKQKAAEKNDMELFNKLVDAENKAISQTYIDELTSSEAWTKLFDNLDNLTIKKIKELKAKIVEQMQGMDFTPEDIENLTKYLDQATDQIDKRNPFKALKKALEDYKEEEGDEDLSKVFIAIGESVGMIGDMFQTVTGSLEQMGVTMDDVTRGILDDVGSILDGVSNLIVGIVTDNPLQAVQGAVDLLASGIDLIWGTKDRKILRSIDEHQQTVDDLVRAYSRLQDAIDDALGTDVFALQMQAINNLKEQNQELNNMVDDEEKRKKSDKDKLNEYRDQIYQNQQMISDIQTQMAEQITQTTAKTAADELMDALVSAWAAGEDAAKAWGDTVEEIMQKAVVNAVKMQIIEKLVNKAIDNLLTYMGHWEGTNFVFDGLTPQEQKAWTDQMNAIYESLKPIFDNMQKMFPEWQAAVSGEGMAGAIKGVSEETASLIAGQMNAMRLNQAQSLDFLRQQLSSLSGIKENTDVLPESLTQLRAIASNTTQSLGLFTGTGIKVRY